MADADLQQRLASIVARVEPLGQMTPGSPLRSEDWNAIVAAVLDLARITAAREQSTADALGGRFAPKDHDHTGHVTTAWFDPGTQALVAQRGGAPELSARMDGLAANLSALRKDVDALKAQFNAFKLRVDGLDDAGRAHDERLGRVEVRLEATRDIRADITRIDGRFTAINDAVQQALVFKNQLVDGAGHPIDLPAVARRIDDLQVFRDGLKAPDGSLVRYRDFDARVAAIETKVITTDKLDQTISDRLSAGGVVDSLSATVLEKVKAQTDARLADVGGRIDRVQNDLSNVATQAKAGADAIDKLSARTAVAEGQIGRVSAIDGKVSELGGRINGIEGVVQQHTSAIGLLADMPSRLEGLTGRVATIEPLGGAVRSLQNDLAATKGRLGAIDGLDTRLRGVEAATSQIPGAVQRVANLETQFGAARADVNVLQQQLAVTRSDVQGISGQLQRARNDVTSLQTTLNEHNTALKDLRIAAPVRVDLLGGHR